MIELELNDEASATLERLAAQLEDMTEVMQDLGEFLMESTKGRFKQGVAPDGTPWAPKSEATKQRYQKNRKTPLVDMRPLFGESGRLHNEITYALGSDRSSVEIGSNLIYSGVMQFGAAQGAFGAMANGSPIPWGNIPARPFLGLSDEDQHGITATIEEWLGRATGQPD